MNDTTNGTTGSTVWCDAPFGGNVVSGTGTNADCPTSLEEVTGLRFLRPGAFTPSDVFTIAVAMTPHGNTEGDVYENSTSGPRHRHVAACRPGRAPRIGPGS